MDVHGVLLLTLVYDAGHVHIWNFRSASLAPVTSGAQRVHSIGRPPREDAVRQSQKEVNTSTRDLTVRLRTHTRRCPLDVMHATHTKGMLLDPRGRAESVHLNARGGAASQGAGAAVILSPTDLHT